MGISEQSRFCVAVCVVILVAPDGPNKLLCRGRGAYHDFLDLPQDGEAVEVDDFQSGNRRPPCIPQRGCALGPVY